MRLAGAKSRLDGRAHNPLVLGSNPGGPTKNFRTVTPRCGGAVFFFLSNSLPDLGRLGKRHRASFAVIRRHLESYDDICVRFPSNPRAIRLSWAQVALYGSGCLRAPLVRPCCPKRFTSASPCAISGCDSTPPIRPPTFVVQQNHRPKRYRLS